MFNEQACLMRLPFERHFAYHQATRMIIPRTFKGNMRTWKERTKLTEKNKLHNVTS